MAERTFDAPAQWAWASDGFIFDLLADEREDRLADILNPSHAAESDVLLESVFELATAQEHELIESGGFESLDRRDVNILDDTFSAKGGGGGKPSDGGDKSKGGNGKGGGGGKPAKDGGGSESTDGGGSGGTILTYYLSGGEVTTSYNVEVVFDGTWTAALQQAFIDAADYLSSIILGDLPDMPGSEGSGGGTIDDIRIMATLTDIDGTGGILGQSGPTYVRLDGTWLPAEGVMEFDIADAGSYLSQGTWGDIVLHEMLHTLGFGSIWNVQGLTTGSIAEGNLRFTGANATLAYQSEFSTIAASDPDASLGVPIETDGGPGTAGGHWDEALFDNELMTGYIDGSNYLSDMTVAALEDMGYETVFESALLA